MKKILPDSIIDFFKHRLLELYGVGFFMIGLVFLLSLASYHPGDPSFNSASPFPAENLLGSFGSYISDVFLQLFGYSSLLIIAFFWAWSWRLLNKQKIDLMLIRLLLIPLTLIFASLLVTSFARVLDYYPYVGQFKTYGSISPVIYSKFELIPFLQPWISHPVLMTVLSSITAGALIFYIAMLSWEEWKAFFKSVVSTSYAATMYVSSKIYRGMRWLVIAVRDYRREAPYKEQKSPVVKKKKATKKSSDDFEAVPALLVEKPEKKTTRKGRKAKADPETIEIVPQSAFRLPQLNLLAQQAASAKPKSAPKEDLQKKSELLETTLKDFGVKGQIVQVRPGPVVTLYELEPAPGTKTSRVVSLADDIARSMSVLAARVATIPGKNVIGIELPNETRETVYLRDILSSKTYESTAAQLPFALGKNIGGSPIIVDLVRMPHLLIAGTTGSGKSVSINAMILSLLYSLTPDQCRFIMIDPKMLELSVYDHIPHLLTPVVTDPKEAILALKWAVREMENRYQAMSKLGVRNIIGYNQRVLQAQAKGEILTKRVQTGFDPETGAPQYEEQTIDTTPLPYIVVIVDEIADLMLVAGKEVEATIQRLAQMARAAGIHLVLATQRPSVDVITGTIKANLPTRISFHLTSKIDSRTILGEQGAEQLLGMGDMLYMATGGRLTRIHGPFVSDEEVEKVTDFLRKQSAPTYEDEITQECDDQPMIPGLDPEKSSGGDDLYNQAIEIIRRDQKVSTSYIQRRLQIGYNRAARIIEQMEEEGIISQPNKAGKREIL